MNAEFPMVDVLSAAPLPEHKLRLRFSDGSEGIYDLARIVAGRGEMVEPLKAADYFARVFVEMGVPTWPNGFDLDPINLYIELRNAGALRQPAPAP
jgi:hypothetical protein